MCVTKAIEMNTFNPKFYQPNRSYTREIAEQRLISLGFSNFTFKSASYANGASFYFESKDGQQIRVSDHRLTGKRAFDVIQVDIEEPKALPSPFKVREMYVKGEISKAEYKAICKEKGFIFKP